MKASVPLLLLCLSSIPAMAQHSSDVIFEEDWSSYAEGPLISGQVWRIEHSDRGVVEVLENPSPVGESLNVLKIEHIDQESWGPRLVGVFPFPVSEAITVSFDFLLDGKSNDQPTFRLHGSTDESPESGLWIALDNHGFPTSIPGRNIINRLSENRADVVCPVTHNQWYRVVLEIAEPAEAAFNIIVTPDGEDPVRVDGLAFRAPLQDYRNLNFFTNCEGGSGILYVGNIKVSTANK